MKTYIIKVSFERKFLCTINIDRNLPLLNEKRIKFFAKHNSFRIVR